VTNALRLNWVTLYKELKIKKENNKELRKEAKIMEKTIHIEGMMCPHCSGRVQGVLEGMEEIASAVVSHETGTAIVTLAAEISDDALKAAVEGAGYKVTGIE
jgi:Cu2+-exporting ATPase